MSTKPAQFGIGDHESGYQIEMYVGFRLPGNKMMKIAENTILSQKLDKNFSFHHVIPGNSMRILFTLWRILFDLVRGFLIADVDLSGFMAILFLPILFP